MITLSLRVHQPSLYSDGVDNGLYAIADVLPYNRESSRSTGSGQRGVKVLVGDNAPPTQVMLAPGTYMVRAKLPSGEVLSQIVEALDPAAKKDVLLQAEESPHEWLSVEKSLGLVPTAGDIITRGVGAALDVTRIIESVVESPKARSRAVKKKAAKRPAKKGRLSAYTAPIASRAAPPIASRAVAVTFDLADVERLSQERLRSKGYDASLAVAEFAFDKPLFAGLDTVTSDTRARRSFGRLVGGRGLAPDQQAGLLSVAMLPPNEVLAEPPGMLKTYFGWPPGPTGANRRRFVVLAEEGKLTRIACVPTSWQSSSGGTPLPVRVLIRLASPVDRSAELAVSVTDSKIASVLAFLARGDLSSASAVISDSYDLLLDKVSNPFAAAAGGYVLVYTGGGDVHGNWRGWISNLANWFPFIPDGAILQATLILQGQEELSPAGLQEAKRLLLAAIDKGPPYYRFGVKALLENLEIVSTVLADTPDADAIKGALRHARWLARRVANDSAFTILDVSE